MNEIETLKQKIEALEAEAKSLKKNASQIEKGLPTDIKHMTTLVLNHSLKFYGIMKYVDNGIMFHIPDVDCSILIQGFDNPLKEVEKRLGIHLFTQVVNYKLLPKASSIDEFEYKIKHSSCCKAFNDNEDYNVVSIDASEEFITLLGCSNIKLRYKIIKREEEYVAEIDGKLGVDTYKTYAEAEKAARFQIFGVEA